MDLPIAEMEQRRDLMHVLRMIRVCIPVLEMYDIDAVVLRTLRSRVEERVDDIDARLVRMSYRLGEIESK
jgi:hypothetical protein